MRSAITVSLVPESKGGPFVFSSGLADACAQAAELGFDAIEIFPPSAESIDPAELGRLLERHRLRVAAIGTGAGWVVRRLTLTHSDPAIRRQAVDFIRSIIDLAGRFGAPTIIGSMQGRWEGAVSREQALSFLGTGLEELGEHAAGHGVPLLYEPLNRYETNLLNRMGETAAWLRTLRTRNVRILADLFHLGIEESNTPAALREARDLVGHIHFADSNRRAVGFGQAVLPPVIEALREIGYTGYLSAEVLPLPDALSAARRTIQSYRALT